MMNLSPREQFVVPSVSSTPSFPRVRELELYVEWEGHHSTRVMGKGRVWIHESGWWQLMEALLRSHRTSPSPPTPHLLDWGEHRTTFATTTSKPRQRGFQMDVEMHLWPFWKWSPGCLPCVVVFPEASASVFEVLDHLYLTSAWSHSLQVDRKLYCEGVNSNEQDWLGACYLGSLGYKYLSSKMFLSFRVPVRELTFH